MLLAEVNFQGADNPLSSKIAKSILFSHVFCTSSLSSYRVWAPLLYVAY